MKRWLWISLGVVALLDIGGTLGVQAFFAGAEHAEYWESAIVDFEQADREAAPAPGAIVFTGSSSIRMWKTLREDMAPRYVLNRGFGGAHLDHVNAFAARIVLPYEPSAIVVYAGDNDIGSGKDVARVVADFERFVTLVREGTGGSGVPVFFIAIKPSRMRWSLWPTMAEANAAIAERCERDVLLHYIDIATPMLAEAEPGEAPPGELFILDGLHLSEAGYAMWTRVTRAALDEALGRAAGE